MASDSNDIVRTACRWSITGVGDIVNVNDLRLTDLLGSASDTDVLGAVGAWYIATYDDGGLVAKMCTVNVHQDISVFNMTKSYPVGYVGRLSALDGGDSNELPPTGLTGLVVFRTHTSRKVGRKYLPPFTVPDLENGVWGSAALAAMSSWADEMLLNHEVGDGFGLQYTVASASGFPSAHPYSYAVRSVPAYQRRRKAGVGS